MVLKYEGYSLDNNGLLSLNKIIYIPPNCELRSLILSEAHRVVYMAHLGVTKMKVDLEPWFFWKRINEDIVRYVVRCLECHQVKDEHRHPVGLIQPHFI
jgi:hypothetical protein